MEQQKMEKNGVIETRTERRTVITRDGDNIDHDKVTGFLSFDITCYFSLNHFSACDFCNIVIRDK